MTDDFKYKNIDGLRAYSAIGIILMHVMTNRGGNINSTATVLIAPLGVLVELFFIISGFGMCCGYYDKIKNNEISVKSFYDKRYMKILPYFALLTIIDVVVAKFNVNSIIEAFCNVTLMFGYFPNPDISVIGVGWALGVIFAFYILFPFFVYMIWNKKKAWLSMIVTIVMYYIINHYFDPQGLLSACNIARWLCYFTAGGLVYLHRDEIVKRLKNNRIICLIALIAAGLSFYILPSEIAGVDILPIKLLLIFSYILCYAITFKSSILDNKLTRFLSSISFEIYLAHMIIFRVLERVGILHLFASENVSYIFEAVCVVIFTSIFAYTTKWFLDKILNVFMRKE